MGLLQGNEGDGYVMEAGEHQCTPVFGRIYVHEARLLGMRPVGPSGGRGSRPDGDGDQRAQVPYDLGEAKETVRLLGVLRRGQIPIPIRQMGVTQGVCGLDLDR